MAVDVQVVQLVAHASQILVVVLPTPVEQVVTHVFPPSKKFGLAQLSQLLIALPVLQVLQLV